MQTYTLDRSGASPLYEQLYRALKADILSGALPGGSRLPSGRALAEHLGLSRVTVETAYAQLLAEGYLTSRPRAGYFVEQLTPQELPPRVSEPEAQPPAPAFCSTGGRSFCDPRRTRAFRPCGRPSRRSCTASAASTSRPSRSTSARARSIFTIC